MSRGEPSPTSTAAARAGGATAGAGLGLASGLAFVALAAGVATASRDAPEQMLTATVCTLLAGAGLVAAAALARMRGQLSLVALGVVFTVLFCAFHFGTLGAPVRGWYVPAYVPLAWALSATCLLGFLSGYAVGLGKTRIPSRAPPGHGPLPAALWGRVATRSHLEVMIHVGVTLFLFGVALQVVVIASVGFRDFFSLQYLEGKQLLATEGSNRIAYAYAFGLIACNVGSIAACVASALGRRRALPSPAIAALGVAYAITLVLQGDRSQLAILVFPPLVAQHLWVRPLPWRRVALVGAAILILASGIKVFRGSRDLGDLATAVSDPTRVSATVDEAGTTLDTVVRSMTLVPESVPYFAGRTYVEAAARALPNVTLSERTWGFVSSTWITQQTEPKAAARKNGLGFSIVAEAYINFGMLGAPLVFLAIGLLHGRLERALYSVRTELAAATACLVLEVALLTHVRNSAVLYVRGGIWMLVVLGLGLVIVSFAGASSRRKMPTTIHP